MYHTCVLNCLVISDSSTVPINRSTILYWQLTRNVFSTDFSFPVHGCPSMSVWLIPKPQVSSPDVFTTQLLSTTVRHVDTAEAFAWQTSAGFPVSPFWPLYIFTTALCVISTQHCRCDIQCRTDPMVTAYECSNIAFADGTKHFFLLNAFCPLMTRFHQDYII